MNPDVANGQETNWLIVIKACSKDTRRVARMWLWYTLFYWLIPTVIVICGLAIAKKEIKILSLIIHGELLIYSITLVAGSTRLITKDVPNTGPFVNRQAFNLISQIMMLPAICAYGLLRYIGATSDPYAVNTKLVVAYSVVLLIGSFIFSYIVFLIDAQRASPGDVQKRAAFAIAHSPDKLDKDFDDLQSADTSVPLDQTKAKLDAEFDAARSDQ